MTTRKSLLLGASLAMAFSGTAAASERNRGAAANGSGSGEVAAVAVPTTTYRRLDATSAMATVNGQEMKLSVDGSVRYDDMVAQYGSIERMQFEAVQANVPSSLGPDGTRLYANGATGFYADLLGSNMPKPAPRTIAEFKELTPWVEQLVDGVTVVVFANGAVVTDSSASFSQPEWVRHRSDVASRVDENGVRFYADGAVYQEPLVQPKESQ